MNDRNAYRLRHEQFNEKLDRLYGQDEGLEGWEHHAIDVTIQVTDTCNMACTYCYQHNRTPARLNVEDGKKFIDILLAGDERSTGYVDTRHCRGIILNFIGGEPFMEIDTVDELTDYFISRMIELDHPCLNRYRIGFSSNGLLYFEPKVQEYLRKNKGHVSLSITVDGNKELHDMCRRDVQGNPTYDRAMAAANDWIKSSGCELGTKITLSPDNLKFTDKALIEFAENGRDDINCNCVYEEGWTIDHARELYTRLKNVADYLVEHNLTHTRISILDDQIGVKYNMMTDRPYCGGCGDMVALDVRGNIYPCIRYMPNSVGDRVRPLKIGDVEHGFMSTEEQVEAVRQLKATNRESQCRGDCIDCPIGAGCGDCAGYSYEVFGEIGRRTTFICDMHKARCLAVHYYKRLKGEDSTLNVPREWAIPIIGEEEYDKLIRM